MSRSTCLESVSQNSIVFGIQQHLQSHCHIWHRSYHGKLVSFNTLLVSFNTQTLKKKKRGGGGGGGMMRKYDYSCTNTYIHKHMHT